MTGNADLSRRHGDRSHAATIDHWYDFICPFCYVAQSRNEALREAGAHLSSNPFEAHPEIPRSGTVVGRRHGAMYDFIEDEARAAGLVLRWPPRIPNARLALSAAAWVTAAAPSAAVAFDRKVFAAHFADGGDIGDPACIDACAAACGVDLEALHQALADGSASDLLSDARRRGLAAGIAGTPAWFGAGTLVSGLKPKSQLLALLLPRS